MRIDPDEQGHGPEYQPRPTWKCRIGLHRWVTFERRSKPDWTFYDDQKCWRCYKARTIEISITNLFYRR